MTTYVDIILPLAVGQAYTYSVPTHLLTQVSVGALVVAPLGRSKYYSGVVVRLHHDAPPADISIKDILEVNTSICLTSAQIQLWMWMAEYYMCSPGEVMKAALPTGLKVESETLIELHEDFTAPTSLTPREQQIWAAIPLDKSIKISQLQRSVKGASIMPHIRALLAKGAIKVGENLARQYRPLYETIYSLHTDYQNEDALDALFTELQRTTRLREALLAFLQLCDASTAFNTQNMQLLRDVTKSEFMQQPACTPYALNALVSKGILVKKKHKVNRIKISRPLPDVMRHALSEQQQASCDAINAALHEKQVCLLHGVTSSGKTEVYIQLIQQTLDEGKQVLYLLPEIALTTQITQRLGRVFGDKVGVYHSKFPDNERVEMWQKQTSDTPFPIILGVRSSIFLPWKNLGLVIIDEEHETSFKQYDPAPRYHARDTALVMARILGAKTLLGTATPSVETYYHALQGKYGWVEMLERFGAQQMPQIIVEDMKELLRKRLMRMPFTPRLLEEMRHAFDNKEQVILFQNRRGYAPILECKTCGWTPHCQTCDVSLTVHKSDSRVTCHYCGQQYRFPERCPQCGENNFRDKGYGTERIESLIHGQFPLARTSRMDLDTTRSRTGYDKIIDAFAKGDTDILIGTQMVTKGLDFENVRVVGIINADQMLNAPDFRAREHAFQMLSQVAGRAGRKGRQGMVVLQTRNAQMPVVKQIVEHDYKAMYRTEIAEREEFLYPPFCRIINIYIRHRDDRVCQDAAEKLLRLLHPAFGARLLGPQRPDVARVKMLYIRKIMLKVLLTESVKQVRTALFAAQNQLQSLPELRGCSIAFDVDPE